MLRRYLSDWKTLCHALADYCRYRMAYRTSDEDEQVAFAVIGLAAGFLLANALWSMG